MYTEKGSFTHEGVRYDIERVFRYAHKIPTMNFWVRDLLWVLKHDHPREDRVLKADLNAPIIVTKDSRGKLTVVDGLHRLAKADQLGLEYIKGKYISPKDLDQFKMDNAKIASQVYREWSIINKQFI